MADETKRAAVYVSWATMKGALDQLSQGIPSRIDRSVFPGKEWNVQSQLFAGMRFLGLLKGEGEPTPLLSDLVQGSEDERKQKLRKILEERYADLIALDLAKVTPSHLEEAMGTLYGVTGDTKGKAVRFFVNAAGYVGIKLSPLIASKKTGTPNGSKPRRRSANKQRSDNAKNVAQGSTLGTPEKPTGTAKTVSLASGGTLTLSATLDLFSLNAADRKFVFELIDKLEGYAQQVPSKDGNAQP